MDSYNQMMDAEYGSMMYNTVPQQPPSEELLMQHNPDAAKDMNCMPQQIPVGPMETHHHHYQHHQHLHQHHQQQQVLQEPYSHAAPVPIENGENSSQYSHQQPPEHIQSTHPDPQDEGVADESLEQQQENNNSKLDEAPAEPVVEQLNENPAEIDGNIKNEEGDGKLTSLEIEPAAAETSVAAEGGQETVATKSEEEIDENQCRVCLSKEGLINIFTYDNSRRICDIIMAICTSVKILEKDYLPHYICTQCLDKLRVAQEFKTACETTDQELRKKMKRGKNKSRRPGRYLLIDCELSSSEDDKKEEDDEFKISDGESDSDASFTIGKRKRPSPKKRRVRKPPPAKTPAPSKRTRPTRNSNRSSTRNQSPRIPSPVPEVIPIHHVFVDAPRIIPAPPSPDPSISDEDEKPLSKRSVRKSTAAATAATAATASSNKAKTPSSSSKIPHKKRAIVPKSDVDDESSNDASLKSTPSKSKKSKEPREPKERPCNVCDQVFHSWQGLKDHKKTHKGEKPLLCNICNKAFRQRVSLEHHIQKHKADDTRICKPCNKMFASRLELRKHQQTVHEDEYTFECDKCKRSFTSKQRLDKHKEGKCPGFDTTIKKKPETEVTPSLGRDLFKCVAPLTSTYWSDSFSD